MKAVILAGGKGTRLGKLAADLPKPMVRIGGKPVLEHQVRLLARYGIRDILLSTGHLAERIADHFGDGSRWGVQLRYAQEEEPLGTAGALKRLEAELQEDFLVLYGDVLLDVNLRRLLRFHSDHGGAGTLVLHPNDHPQDSDLVEIDPDTQQVLAFHAKPHAPGHYHRNLVNAALYVLSPRVLSHIPAGIKADLGRHVFPEVVQREVLFGYVTAEYLKDMGTPQRLREVSADYRRGRVARFNNENSRPALFLDRDGVLNRHVGLLSRPEQLELLPGVAEAVQALNRSDYLAVTVTNQPVVARGLCSPAELEQIHGRLEALLAEGGARLDAIYHCPHHPDRGYPGEDPRYKVACDCRKPGIGMVRRAAADFHIRLEDSYLIGDTVRDVECGQRAGVATVAVMSGERWTKWECEPDFVFATLNEAVTFILTDPLRDAFERIYEDFVQAQGRGPFIVTVDGGLRPAGRNFASYLVRSFKRRGRSVLRVSYDECVLRGLKNGQASLGCDPAALEALLQTAPESGRLNEVLTGRGVEVVVVEGEPPATVERHWPGQRFRVFCELAEELIVAGLQSFLAWRGFGDSDIAAIVAGQRSRFALLAGRPPSHADMLLAV